MASNVARAKCARVVPRVMPVIKPRAHLPRKMLMNAISPLSLAAYSDDPLFQLGNAHQYCKLEVSTPNEPYAVSPDPG